MMWRQETPAERGFTLLEITMVMALLFIFMAFLTQLLLDTTEVFSEGTRGQELAQRTLAAQRPLNASLEQMAGLSQRGDAGADARLIVQWQRRGLGLQGNRMQVLRSTVTVDRATEQRLLMELADRRFAASFGQVEDAREHPRYAELLQQVIDELGLLGRAQMLLLTWPQGDAEGAFSELRRGLFLPGEALPFEEADGRGLMEIEALGEPHFPAPRVVPNTEVLASGILHLEYRFWSQYTQNWIHDPEAQGPEWVWDSARAGLFDQDKPARQRFTLDLGRDSLQDASDDVFPHWIRYTLVVGSRADGLPETVLADPIAANDKVARLRSMDSLPVEIVDNMVKIGSEWVRFSERRGRTLRGLRRGQRGTTPKDHAAGTGVRIGQTRVGYVRVLHGRDNWNG